MELWINEIWLLVTAVIFTMVGWWFGVTSNVREISGALIDKLIEDGYVRARTLPNGDIELLKHNEE